MVIYIFILVFQAPVQEMSLPEVTSLVFRVKNPGVEVIPCMFHKSPHSLHFGNISKLFVAERILQLAYPVLSADVESLAFPGIEAGNNELHHQVGAWFIINTESAEVHTVSVYFLAIEIDIEAIGFLDCAEIGLAAFRDKLVGIARIIAKN